jgi:tetratricopeptide (TPR) repeat protein
MTSRWLLLILFMLVFAPSPLNAQPTSEGTRMGPNLRDARDTYYNKMYEDIEIFRRILGRELQPLYARVSAASVIGNPFTSSATAYSNTVQDSGTGANSFLYTPNTTYSPGSGLNKQEVLSSLEGVYLKGQGVVYTATVLSLQPPSKATTAGPVRLRLTVHQSDSDWESIRRQIRNEKEQPKKAETSKPPTLSDVLLKVLAENGHNFSQLGENETLTLVLTVHETGSSSATPKSGAASTNSIEYQAATSNRASEERSQLRDLELLGELHLKQGKYEEAIRVFNRLLAQTTSSKEVTELYRKLAQCYLMQGQEEKARAVLDQAIALMKKEAEAKDKPLLAAKPAAALPVKLMISVQKKLLDQVKEGKITFEDFRRHAHVETLRFDARR